MLLFLSQIKAKKISEIHTEAEMKLGLRPGSTTNMRNGRTGTGRPLSPGAFPMNGPGTGGMMPGMPGARKMPGMPGLDDDNWEVPRRVFFIGRNSRKFPKFPFYPQGPIKCDIGQIFSFFPAPTHRQPKFSRATVPRYNVLFLFLSVNK